MLTVSYAVSKNQIDIFILRDNGPLLNEENIFILHFAIYLEHHNSTNTYNYRQRSKIRWPSTQFDLLTKQQLLNNII